MFLVMMLRRRRMLASRVMCIVSLLICSFHFSSSAGSVGGRMISLGCKMIRGNGGACPLAG